MVGEVEPLVNFWIQRGGGGRTDQRGGGVCPCCRRKAEECVALRVRHTFDIVVGEVDTLVKFCGARERLGMLKIQLPQQETVIRGTRGTGVCVCCRGREGRGKRRVTGERQTFDIVVGEVATLAKILIERGGERTDQKGRVCVCVSAVEGRPRKAWCYGRETDL